MKKLPLLALLLLGGCYATAEPIYLPDGTSGYRVTCGDYAIGTTADCMQKAGEICGPNGYQMFDQAGHPKAPDAQTQAVIAALNTSSSQHDKSADNTQAMFVKCKTSDMPVHMTPAPVPPQVEVSPMPPTFSSAPLLSPPAPAAQSPATPANNGPIPLR